MEEVWVNICGWPEYSVSNLGRVKGPRKILKRSVNAQGYLVVKLCKPGLQRIKAVHRLVCEAFHGEPPFPGAIVRHKNNTKSDCSSNNVAWSTHGQNGKDRAQAKTTAGENNGRAVLTLEKVRTIRRRLSAGEFRQELAQEYGVSVGCIALIDSGKTWKDHNLPT